ncbi:Uma2 family endonuclease [Kineosporia succinea]|uniref:Uma2 family endonuclease n=1 Tax=Kineosporia succinea TaxID=84632 RepID=A0ABT9P359_9ACTN|nr:Uma2 family endonuclease [Kineosporia succinea]MDP9827123.1 Uma2 family endonuclease [Kineosporia succinea]
MSAEVMHRACSRADNDVVTNEPVPDWVRKPGGYTVDEFFQLPDLPPHTELIDGGLVFVSPHRWFHMVVLRFLEQALVPTAPRHLRVSREMNVVLGERQAPEPDLSVIRAEALGGIADTRFPAGAVLLAVEVVSPGSEIRDRERKPQLYAAAGIQHYWLVEEEDGRPVVQVYELGSVTNTYGLTGVYRDRLKLTVPYDIDIDLTEVDFT